MSNMHLLFSPFLLMNGVSPFWGLASSTNWSTAVALSFVFDTLYLIDFIDIV